MSMLQQSQIIEVLNADSSRHQLSTASTFTAFHENGEIMGYVFGDGFSLALKRLLDDYLGPLNQERIQRLEALLKEDHLSMEAVVAAAIDPLIEVLQGENARIYHFCYRSIHIHNTDVDQQLWWTPTLGKVLKKLAAQDNITIAPRAASMLNELLYKVVHTTVEPQYLPLKGSRSAYYERFFRQLTTVIFSLEAAPG